MMGVFLVVAIATILKSHVRSPSEYVMYDTTSPGNPSLPSGSTMLKVMLDALYATTLKLRQSQPSSPPWRVSAPRGASGVGFSLGVTWKVSPSIVKLLFLMRLA